MADLLTDTFIRIRHRLKFVSGKIMSQTDWTDDILQDCFVRLWRRRYNIQSEKEAEALLTKTVRNASINENRRNRMLPLSKDYPDEFSDVEDKERSYAEMERMIRTELTEKQRYILEEKEYGGRTLEDIAEELKMEPAAVRMQLSRARKTLKNVLRDDR